MSHNSEKLLKNISFSLVSKAWRIVLPIASTPFIVHHMGLDAYGIMSILTVFAGYFALSDLGLTGAIEKYIAEYNAKGLGNKVRDITQVGMIYFFGVSIVGFLLLWFCFDILVNYFLDIPPELVNQTKTSYLIVSCTFSISIFTTFFSSILRGYQRFDLIAYRTVIVYTFSIAATILVLYLGYGLVAVVSVTFIISIININLFYFLVKQNCMDASLVPKWDNTTFYRLFHFSKWKFLGGLSSALSKNVSRVIVGILLNVQMVTYLAIVQLLAQSAGRRFGGEIVKVLYPYMSETAAVRNKYQQRRVYFTSVKWLFSLLAIPTVFLVVYGDIILDIWMGSDFASEGTFLLRSLTMLYWFTSTFWFITNIFEASGNSLFPNVCAAVIGFSQIIFYLIFIPIFGINGIFFAHLMVITIGLYGQDKVLTMLESSWFEYFKKTLLLPLFGSIIIFTILLLAREIHMTITLLIITGIASCIIHILIYYLIGVFEENEKQIFHSFFLKRIPFKHFQPEVDK